MKQIILERTGTAMKTPPVVAVKLFHQSGPDDDNGSISDDKEKTT
jgi:hypothetical protein